MQAIKAKIQLRYQVSPLGFILAGGIGREDRDSFLKEKPTEIVLVPGPIGVQVVQVANDSGGGQWNIG